MLRYYLYSRDLDAKRSNVNRFVVVWYVLGSSTALDHGKQQSDVVLHIVTNYAVIISLPNLSLTFTIKPASFTLGIMRLL